MASVGEGAAVSIQGDVRTLYAIIDELRREHSSPAALRTIDLVVRELGRTQDNLKEALEHLEGHPIPTGGQQVLSELRVRALLAAAAPLPGSPPPPEGRPRPGPPDRAGRG